MSEKKPVYLLAGGGKPFSDQGPDPVVRDVLKETDKVCPRIGYIGTASDDDPRFFRYTDFLIKAGAGRVDHALIASEKSDLARARDILEAADGIILGGGDVARGMWTLEQKGMVGFLRGLHARGKLFFGFSAGSIMLAKEWVNWRDPHDDSTAELFPCLGLTPVLCDTHDEDGGWEELKTALRLEKEIVAGYGIATGSCLKVFSDGRVEGLRGPVYRYLRNGEKLEKRSVRIG